MKKILLMLGIGMFSYFRAHAQFPAPYCTDTFQYDTEPITLVNFAGINNTSGNAINVFPDNEDFTSITGSVILGTNYPITLKGNTGGGWTNYFTVFIDWNQNNSFNDAGEKYNIGTITGSTGIDLATATGTIAVPGSALAGTTRMRVHKLYAAYPAAACLNTGGFGQTEDYSLTVAAPSGCTGTPTAGTASATANSCPGDMFALNLTGYTIATGIDIQWQSSPDDMTYTNIPSGTTPVFNVSLTDTTYYRAVVTCSGSGLTDTSNEIMVGVGPCHCIPSYSDGTDDGDYLGLVQLGAINNVTGGAPAPYYTFYGMSTDLMQGSTHTLTVGAGTYGTNDLAAWIDFNQNGVYEASEKLGESDDLGASPATDAYSFVVPLSATPGLTYMRVMEAYANAPGIDPCLPFGSYGETEDYIINILPAPVCAGTPVAGTAVSSETGVCTGEDVTLSLTGNTVASQLGYQWQSSPDGTTWTSIVSADSTAHVTTVGDTTFFRCIVTCIPSGMSDTSTVVQVNFNPFYMCYCTEDLHNGNTPCIENVTVGTLNNTTTGGCTLPAYASFPATGSTTTDLAQTVMMPFTVTDEGFAIVSVWIDYDHSGTFDPAEWSQVTTSSGSGGVSTIFVTVPSTSMLGMTGMRVRARGEFNPNGPTDACSEFGSGETEDYIVNIVPAPPCINPPVGGTIAGQTTDTIMSQGQYVLTGNNGDNIQWYVSTDGGTTYTFMAGENNDTLTVTFDEMQPEFTYIAVSSSPGCVSDSSNVITTYMFTNDNVCDALPLQMGVNGPFTTIGATTQTDEVFPPAGDCEAQWSWCNNTITNTVWFTFVAPASGRVSIVAPSFDTQLAVWKADDCSDLLDATVAEMISANDDDSDYVDNGVTQYSSKINGLYCLVPGETYYLQMDAFDEFNPDTTSIILTDIGAPLTPSVSLSDSMFCAPITLDAGPSGPGSIYVWSNGDSTQTSVFSLTDTIFVTVTDTFGCASSDTAILTNITLDPSFIANQVGIGVFNFDNTSTPGSGVIYEWDFGDGTTSNAENPSHTYGGNGSYTVELVVSNECGTDSISQTIVVNGIGVNEIGTDYGVKVYPNPAMDWLNVVGHNGNLLNVEMINTAGQRVITKTNVNNTQLQLDVTGLDRGVYIVNVLTTEGIARTRITLVR